MSAALQGPVTPTLGPPFDRCVFVNCPFDDDYLPLLHAILFAIHDCGFIARIAVEDVGSGETRLDKIVRIIDESRYSIHDISRVEITAASPLPRFNMAFECGLAFGALRFASRKGRDFLFMAAEPHQDKLTLSDLAGQDSKAHRNDPRTAVGAVRSFLAAKSSPNATRGTEAIWKRYQRFSSQLFRLAQQLGMTEAEIASFDYVRDWLQVMTLWLRADISRMGKRRRF